MRPFFRVMPNQAGKLSLFLGKGLELSVQTLPRMRRCAVRKRHWRASPALLTREGAEGRTRVGTRTTLSDFRNNQLEPARLAAVYLCSMPVVLGAFLPRCATSAPRWKAGS